MPRKVAAVYGRDVARIKRTQILSVVPVVKMTAIALQAPHGRECRLQAFNGFHKSCPSEVARADGGQQIEAQVGGGGSMRQYWSRIFLEVIRRQHLVVRRHKFLEVTPAAARDEP